MMIDISFIATNLDKFSADPIAEPHVSDRQRKKRHRHHDKQHVLHNSLLQTQSGSGRRSELNQNVDVDRRLVSAQIGEPYSAALRSTGCLRGAESRNARRISVVAS